MSLCTLFSSNSLKDSFGGYYAQHIVSLHSIQRSYNETSFKNLNANTETTMSCNTTDVLYSSPQT